jgi:hypothetical protein
MAVFITQGQFSWEHSTNLPERRNNLSGYATICGRGRCSQKSPESGVLNAFSPGAENTSCGVRMMVLLFRVGVTVLAMVAKGTLVLSNGLSAQLLKTRLKRRAQGMIIRILLLLV